MELSFMQNELVLALCWTLIHSLWQGLLLATVTGAVMIGTRKSKANRRYRLLVLLFFAFVGVTVFTFIKEYSAIAHANAMAATTPSIAAGADAWLTPGLLRTDVSGQSISLLQRFKDYFNTHASLIVTIWFIIFMARLVRFGANLVYVNRLRHYKTSIPSEEWSQKLNLLITTLGIRKPIKMLESGIVKVPLVMGVLKPVILLPAGLLAHLPADEIEAILLHELAHIQRRDYLVNLLQNIAETIFFFNPALMWVSSMIREERENCCDDIAIAVTNSKSNFINALIAFQEYHYAGSRYNLAFPGRKNQLLNRVKRIVHEKNKTLNATEKSLLTLGLGVFILFSFAAAKKINPPLMNALSQSTAPIVQQDKIQLNDVQLSATPFKRSEAESTISVLQMSAYAPDAPQYLDEALLNTHSLYSDTTPAKKTTSVTTGRWVMDRVDSVADRFGEISVRVLPDNKNDVTIDFSEKDGARYKVHKIDSQVKELFVNGQPVTETASYTTLLADLDRAIANRSEWIKERWRLSRDREKALLLDKQSRLQSLQQLSALKQEQGLEKFHEGMEWKKEHQQLSKTDSLHALQLKITFDLKEKSFSKTADFHKESDLRAQFSKDTFNLTRKRMTGTVTMSDGKARNAPSRTKDDFAAQTDKFAAKRDAMRLREAADQQRQASASTTVRNIVSDLEKEGVKMDLEKGWFALDKDQFVVDGKSMPREIHEKFVARFVTSPDGWGYYYGPVKVTGRGIFMDYRNLSR